MGFLGDLKLVGSDLLSKGGDAAKDAMVKAQDAAEMAKLKVDIAAREKEIKDIYTEIGRKYYEQYKDDASEFQTQITQIEEKFAKIRELKSKYEMHKDAVKGNKESDMAADAVYEAKGDMIDVVIMPQTEEAWTEENMSEAAEFVCDSEE